MRIQIGRYEDGIFGLPKDGRCFPVTNSMFSNLVCPLKFWFSEIEELRRLRVVQDRGTAWHTITEDIFKWWMIQDLPYPETGLRNCVWCSGTGIDGDPEDGSELPCDFCSGSGDGPVTRAINDWQGNVEDENGFVDEEVDLEKERARLERAAHGYLLKFHNGPLDLYEVAGVEVGLARVIRNPKTGKPYCPEIYLQSTETGFVLAGTSSLHLANLVGSQLHGLKNAKLMDVVKVRWPVYQIGRLDVILRDRKTREGWILDTKFTKNPKRYREGMGVDPQLPGYCWLLEAHTERFKLSRVIGFMYDLTNSRFQDDPDELQWKPPQLDVMKMMAEAQGIKVIGRKSEDYQQALGIKPGQPELSRRKVNSIPSWRYRDAIRRKGLHEPSYEDHLGYLENEVDPDFYQRCWETYGDSSRKRSAVENYSKARQVLTARRAASRVADSTDLAVAFPRQPNCLGPAASCQYRGICSQDSEEARSAFKISSAVEWITTPDPVEPDVFGANEDLETEVGF